MILVLTGIKATTVCNPETQLRLSSRGRERQETFGGDEQKRDMSTEVASFLRWLRGSKRLPKLGLQIHGF